MHRKILFVTGTRADFGKIKSLLAVLQPLDDYEVTIFVTGMHMMKQYGSTWIEVSNSKLGDVFPFVNQGPDDSMASALSKTISGLSDYVIENTPDLIVVHGDRIEALAGAIVGALSNIKIAHIEGGELSGTIDESIRHSISKLSHIHLVSNQDAANRLVRMGERQDTIFAIGSPDIDAMNSTSLPSLEETKTHYGITFETYSILLLHPVTTETEKLSSQLDELINSLQLSGRNYVVIEPNNDAGSKLIRQKYEELSDKDNFLLFPSMRFEYFLTLLKHAEFIIGNSSAGIREAPHFGVPAVDLGTRQRNRVSSPLVLNIDFKSDEITSAINKTLQIARIPESNFGDGNSANRFAEIIQSETIWKLPVQKQFQDNK